MTASECGRQLHHLREGIFEVKSYFCKKNDFGELNRYEKDDERWDENSTIMQHSDVSRL